MCPLLLGTHIFIVFGGKNVHIKNLVCLIFFTFVFSISVYAGDTLSDSLSLQRNQKVVLETNSSMSDSDYQIIQLYGTRKSKNEIDTMG